MPVSFLWVNIPKTYGRLPTSSTLCQWYAKLDGQRSHECERGTQECVRHIAD